MICKNLNIFIAGIYGTGKSTLCSKLSEQLQIPYFSAGDLISEINGEQYGINKIVRDKINNQILLTNKVNELNQKYKRIILAGHFCIFNSMNDVEILPESVFFNLNISQIVLLEADISVIENNLFLRDAKKYPTDSLLNLLKNEREQGISIAQKLNYPLSIYKMIFSEVDLKIVSEIIKKEINP